MTLVSSVFSGPMSLDRVGGQLYVVNGPIAGRVLVSSPFGPRESFKITKPDGTTYWSSTFHTGSDLVGARGTTIRLLVPGNIEGFDSNPFDGAGLEINVRHANGWRSRYLHTALGYPRIPDGTPVERYAILGFVGNTGASTGPHLHWMVYDADGRLLDPLGARVIEWINGIEEPEELPTDTTGALGLLQQSIELQEEAMALLGGDA